MRSCSVLTGVGFKVGGDTSIKTLVLQVHYKDVTAFLPPSEYTLKHLQKHMYTYICIYVQDIKLKTFQQKSTTKHTLDWATRTHQVASFITVDSHCVRQWTKKIFCSFGNSGNKSTAQGHILCSRPYVYSHRSVKSFIMVACANFFSCALDRKLWLNFNHNSHRQPSWTICEPSGYAWPRTWLCL